MRSRYWLCGATIIRHYASPVVSLVGGVEADFVALATRELGLFCARRAASWTVGCCSDASGMLQRLPEKRCVTVSRPFSMKLQIVEGLTRSRRAASATV